jgi:hypothetical protein
VREKKRAHLRKLTGLYNALSDKYDSAVNGSAPKASLDVFDKTAARAARAEQERGAPTPTPTQAPPPTPAPTPTLTRALTRALTRTLTRTLTRSVTRALTLSRSATRRRSR